MCWHGEQWPQSPCKPARENRGRNAQGIWPHPSLLPRSSARSQLAIQARCLLRAEAVSPLLPPGRSSIPILLFLVRLGGTGRERRRGSACHVVPVAFWPSPWSPFNLTKLLYIADLCLFSFGFFFSPPGSKESFVSKKGCQTISG
jgi:hypothetical protein